MIGVRVTQTERGQLERVALADGLPLATLVRREALRAIRQRRSLGPKGARPKADP